MADLPTPSWHLLPASRPAPSVVPQGPLSGGRALKVYLSGTCGSCQDREPHDISFKCRGPSSYGLLLQFCKPCSLIRAVAARNPLLLAQSQGT